MIYVWNGPVTNGHRPSRLFDALDREIKLPVTECDTETGRVEFLPKFSNGGFMIDRYSGELARWEQFHRAPLRVVPIETPDAST